MIDRIILLSGSVSSGKSTLARGLAGQYGMAVFRTKDVLRNRLAPDLRDDRRALQAEGDRLDERTRGRWVLEELVRWMGPEPPYQAVVVDAVRIVDQVAAIREAYGPRVTHVHLTAPLSELQERFEGRRITESPSEHPYSEVRENPTERGIENLARVADIVVDTQRCTPVDVLQRTASHLGVREGKGRGYVDVVVGGQYGSEGKGQIADYLSKEYDLLVRVGGPNAGHSVFEDPKPYIHHQLPSGSRRGHARLLIGPGATIRVQSLLQEIAECHVDADRLRIDSQAFIITDEDIEQEKPLVGSIGSTGQGVGAAGARRITHRGRREVLLARDIPELKPFIGNAFDILQDAFARGARVLLEGTQGTGLSLFHGKYPHVTSRDTTVSGCLAEAGIPPSRVRKVILVCRTYPIRVESPRSSTSGPLREITYAELAARSGIPQEELIAHEKTSTTRRQRRIGEFEWDLLHRAALLNGATDVALTFTDYITKRNREAVRFDQLSEETIRFIQEVERVAGAPVSLIATGFSHRSIIDRRAW